MIIQTTLKDKVTELEKKCENLKNSLDVSLKENVEFKNNKTTLQESLNSLQKKLKLQDGYEQLMKSKAELIKTQMTEIDKLKKSINEIMESSSLREQQSNSEINGLNSAISSLESIKDELNLNITRNCYQSIELKNKNLKLESTISVYEQLICSSEGFQMLVEEQRIELEKLRSEKSKFEKDLETSLKKIDAAEKRNYELSRILTDAAKSFKLKNSDSELLSEYINSAKKLSILYIPVNDDEIDIKLAEELNNIVDTQGYNGLFTRQGAGSYKYGSKEVILKIDKGKILGNFIIITLQ